MRVNSLGVVDEFDDEEWWGQREEEEREREEAAKEASEEAEKEQMSVYLTTEIAPDFWIFRCPSGS